MKVQCSKVHHISTWAGLPLNYSKCEVTGILHGTNPHNPTSTTQLEGQIKNKIPIGSAFAKYTPPTESCRNLGVLITLTLDWIPQVERMVGIVQDKGDRLIYKAKPAGASPRQLLNLIQTAIKPAVIYTMAVAPYRPQDLARLDMAIATITKKCTNLAISTSSAAIHLPVDEAGMGITSLLVDYLQISASTIIRGLNNTGKLGATTKALLHKQCEMLGDLPPDQLPTAATRYSTVARQYHMMKAASMEIRRAEGEKEETMTPKGSRGLTRLNEVHAGDAIPPALWHRMHELGITTHTQLIAKTGTHRISTTDMQNQWGSKVKAAHKRTLNRISLILTATLPPGYTGLPTRYSPVDPLPLSNRLLPENMHVTHAPSPNSDIQDLMGKQSATNTEPQAHTPAQDKTTTQTKPREKRAKISPTWWNCMAAPTSKQASSMEDTPDKWDAMIQLCKNQTGTAFFKHHKLNLQSTGANLRAAIHTTYPASPPPP